MRPIGLSATFVSLTATLLGGGASARSAEPLLVDTLAEGTLAANEERAFEVTVAAGEYARVEVTQVGLDVALEVRGPDGAVLGAVDHARVRESAEAFGWIASQSGPHRVAVRTARAQPGGRFVLRLEDPRPAGPSERLSLEAQVAFDAAAAARNASDEAARARAIDGFTRAAELWRRAGDGRFEARALVSAGALEWAVHPEPARQKCESALRIVQDAGDVAQESDALACLSEGYYSVGAYDEAIETQLAGLDVAVANGNRFRESEALQNLGVFHAARFDADEARTRYEQAVLLSREIGDDEVLGFALSSQAVILSGAGELQAAHDLVREAIALHRATGNEAARANALNNLAFILQLLGEYEEAEAVGEELVRVAGLTGTKLNGIYGINRLSAIAVARGDTAAGVAFAQRALAAAQEAQAPREERNSLDALAYAHFKAGAFEDALRAATAAMEVSRRHGHPPEPTVILNLCRLREAMGDLEAAATQCDEALAATQAGGYERLQPFASYLRARVDRRQGRAEDAIRRASDSLVQLEAWRGRLRRLDWRASYVESYREIDEFHVDLLVEAAARAATEDGAAAAFDAAEQARARGLRDALMESRQAGAGGVDARLLARARLLRQQLAVVVDRQLRGQRRPETDPSLRQLEEELNDVDGEIRRLGPRYAELNATPTLGVRDLQHQLDDGTVLLAFATGDHRSAMWVVTRERIDMHVLPGRLELDPLVRTAYESYSRRGPASPAVRALARAVVAPAGALKPRVLVIADGSLHYVPFAALPDARGGRLIDRHEVTVLPSVSTVRLLQQRTGRTASRSVALLADPVFRADDERIAGAPKGPRAAANDRALTRAAERFGGLDQLARLPLTRREATRIAALAGTGATVALDFDANLATAREGRLGEYRYVHFATHGFLNPWRPELSGLVLSLYDAQGRSRDGFLSALDAFNLELAADVVVLSGCRTALGKEVQGEGLVGLPQAFMYAGARRVVSSLWAVDDAATAALMARFYEELFAPRPRRPAAALRAAQEWVRAQPQWRDPYYWAAFQLQGDWN